MKKLVPVSTVVIVLVLLTSCAKKSDYECNCTWTDSASQTQSRKYTLVDYKQDQADESCADKTATHKANDGADAACTLTKL